jgi:hypothetical protein
MLYNEIEWKRNALTIESTQKWLNIKSVIFKYCQINLPTAEFSE